MEINVVNKYKHKKTKNDFIIHRPSALGNPYTHVKNTKTLAQFIVNSREDAIKKYKRYFEDKIKWNKDLQKEISKMLHQLLESGEIHLICFCSPLSCHGDVIKEYLLNRIEQSTCKLCYDTGWSGGGDICVCMRQRDKI